MLNEDVSGLLILTQAFDFGTSYDIYIRQLLWPAKLRKKRKLKKRLVTHLYWIIFDIVFILPLKYFKWSGLHRLNQFLRYSLSYVWLLDAKCV